MSAAPERATWADMIREYERPATEKARSIEADLRPHVEALVNLAGTLAGHTEAGEAMTAAQIAIPSHAVRWPEGGVAQGEVADELLGSA